MPGSVAANRIESFLRPRCERNQRFKRLMEEDPTLTTTVDSLSGRLVLNGMGQAHLDMAIERMRRKY